ncbi:MULTISPECIES: porin [unclassified Haematospirillum]|uniref:porin n=1 Tax=unclassified Haematospirillum TaxID=2622088 RepID=UPI00143A0CB1|nr:MULTISPECIES: porin [unclassified Haematospirillum]NKD55584.1 porin [Haematospirillum sp. H4890]NKD75723.1 porin [Haematospirillum sp. H4485]
MKKILVGTSALVAASAIAGSAVAAEPIQLSVGGFGSVFVGHATQSKSYLNAIKKDAMSTDVKGDNEIHFKGKTTLDNGLTVAVKYELEAGGTNNTNDDHISKYAISLGGAFGTVIAGVDDNAMTALAARSPHMGNRLFGGGISEGSLIGGDWVLKPKSKIDDLPDNPDANQKAKYRADQLLKQTDYIDASYITTGNGTESISYLSPSIAGFTLGASYIPDTNQKKHDEKQPTGKKIARAYGVGLGYANTFGGVGVQADIGWLNGGSKLKAEELDMSGATAKSKGRNEYQAGLSLSYSGVTVGGGYHMIKEKLGIDTGANKEVKGSFDHSAWEAGIGYKTGPFGIAVSYLDLKQADLGLKGDLKDKSQKGRRSRAVQLTSEYTMGPGVMLVGGVGYTKFEDKDSKKASDRNKGWVAVTGLSLAF